MLRERLGAPCDTGRTKSELLRCFPQIGSWEGFDQGHSVMKFTHGQHCWNGPARSLTVTMRCGGADAVLKVEEPEVCVYAMDMESPAACTDDDLRRAKDDLALFGA